MHLHDITAATELHGIDIAVLDQPATEPSVESPKTLHESLTPVCSPAGVIPNCHAALAKSTLLHLTAYPDAWKNWFAAAGFTGSPGIQWLVFDDVTLVIEAAIQGQGVAITPAHAVEADLCSGHLTTPFPVCVSSGSRYHITWPKAKDWLQKKLETFRYFSHLVPRAEQI